jgi:4,5-DOPA dioxygenase extradiol
LRIVRSLRSNFWTLRGILLLASGNIVHNLGLFRFHSTEQPAWALRFRQLVNRHIEHRDHEVLAQFKQLGADADLAIPTPEHYLPVLYALAVQRPGDRIRLFSDQVLSAVSMTSIVLGSG